MYSEKDPFRKFEELVAELFRKIQDEDVRRNIVQRGAAHQIFEADILFGDPPNRTVVEVKLYRYFSPPQFDVFVKALRQLSDLKVATNSDLGILVVGCPLNERLKNAAQVHNNVEVWDADELFRRAFDFPDLVREFERLFEARAPANSEIQLQGLIQKGEEASPRYGEILSKKLRSILPGRADAKAFENECIKALKYLFEADLHGWYEQLDTEDELHRRDLICRILPMAEVWRLMLDDLRSRYVVFEFKNYSEQITQKEIVTTERYLYPTALRNIAIIISPKGCAKSADKVIAGAMREHGKLIISLTIDELEKLLIGKDGGADPNTYLFQRVDDFLLGLGR